MSASHLSTYLRDHLAGATAAVEIMDHIETSHGGGTVGDVIRNLRPEILADRAELERLANKIDGSGGTVRRVFGWLGEKTVELKLKIDDPSDGPLRLLEALEVLSLGIEGKIGLWKALQGSSECEAALGTVTYSQLIQRAESQRSLVETERLRAATDAFTMTT